MATKATETKTTAKAPAKKVEAVEPKLVLEQEMQFKLNDRKVLGVHPEANAVVIENKNGGDLYVTTGEAPLISPESLIAPGESKEFEGVKTLVVGSYSRPIFVMKHLAK